MNRLAWVGNDRQLYTAELGRGGTTPLTSPVPPGMAGWGAAARPAEAWSWPTWSPDGRWLAAFALVTSDDRVGPVRVGVVSVDGVQQALWWEGTDEGPIYLQWHPTGRALSALVQRGEELFLGTIRGGELGRLRAVESGVPLFYNWAPGDRGILMHVGTPGRRGSRLVLRDPLGGAEDHLLDVVPGSFCAPVFCGGRAIYAVGDEGQSRVVAASLDGAVSTTLARHPGLLALAGAPRGEPVVAIAAATGGEGTAYAGIDLVNVHTGTSRRLTDTPVIAFFWAPNGAWVLAAEVVPAENCMRWWQLPTDGSTPRDLGTFWPSRDMLFYLHFFDQYTQSHPLVSADSQFVCWAGYPAGRGQADLSGPAQLYVRALDDHDAAATVVAPGVFGVWAPPTDTSSGV